MRYKVEYYKGDPLIIEAELMTTNERWICFADSEEELRKGIFTGVVSNYEVLRVTKNEGSR